MKILMKEQCTHHNVLSCIYTHRIRFNTDNLQDCVLNRFIHLVQSSIQKLLTLHN